MIRYSFVIPSYNNIHGLHECLLSLLSMENPDNILYEVLVVDDGSFDGTYEFICAQHYANTIRILRLERSPESSRARARNFGAWSANGQIVNFLDADILVSKKHLIQLERFFCHDENIVLIGNRSFLGGASACKDVIQSNGYDFRYQIYINQSFNVSAIDYPWAVTYTCNLSISKNNLLSLKGFDEQFINWGLEDLELGFRCCEKGLRICFNPYMDVVHLGTDSREELMFENDRLSKYHENISYFIRKHRLTEKYPAENFYDLLVNGENLCSNLVERNINQSVCIINFDNNYSTKLDVNKALEADMKVILLDYSDSSGLDVWINTQCFSSKIFYFPMNRLDVSDKEKVEKTIFGENNELPSLC